MFAIIVEPVLVLTWNAGMIVQLIFPSLIVHVEVVVEQEEQAVQHME